MKISVDISGQITQKNKQSSLGIKRSDNLEYSVYISSSNKKKIIKKYKGQVIRLIEKMHCIMIYYALKNHLNNVNEFIICRDINFRSIKNYLPLLFKHGELRQIKISQRKSKGPKSKAHYIANKTFKKKKYANQILKISDIEKKLFDFKES